MYGASTGRSLPIQHDAPHKPHAASTLHGSTIDRCLEIKHRTRPMVFQRCQPFQGISPSCSPVPRRGEKCWDQKSDPGHPCWMAYQELSAAGTRSPRLPCGVPSPTWDAALLQTALHRTGLDRVNQRQGPCGFTSRQCSYLTLLLPAVCGMCPV